MPPLYSTRISVTPCPSPTSPPPPRFPPTFKLLQSRNPLGGGMKGWQAIHPGFLVPAAISYGEPSPAGQLQFSCRQLRPSDGHMLTPLPTATRIGCVSPRPVAELAGGVRRPLGSADCSKYFPAGAYTDWHAVMAARNAGALLFCPPGSAPKSNTFARPLGQSEIPAAPTRSSRRNSMLPSGSGHQRTIPAT